MTIYNHRQTCKCSSEDKRRDTDLASTASTTRRSSGNSATSCSVPSVDDDADDVTSWPLAFPFPVTRAVSSCGAAEPAAWRRGAGFGGAGLLTTVDVISINIHHTYVGRQSNKQLLIITML